MTNKKIPSVGELVEWLLKHEEDKASRQEPRKCTCNIIKLMREGCTCYE